MWLLIASVAQIILGSAAVFDKYLLRKQVLDPWAYTFGIGMLGVFAIFAVPFGYASLPVGIIGLAILSGAIFILALLFLYLALYEGHASTSLPMIGGFSPIFTLLFSNIFLSEAVSFGSYIGFTLLAVGGLIFFFFEEEESRFKVAAYTLGSASFLGLSNVFSKIVFNAGSFLTGFFWLKFGGVIFVFLWLAVPRIRRAVLSSETRFTSLNGGKFLANRTLAASGSVLLLFALSLAHPALVDATQGLRYVVIFFFAWILLNEHFRGKVLIGKSVAVAFVIFGIIWLSLINWASSISVDINRKIIWGVTFSDKFSYQLGLEPDAVLTAVMRDLHPKKVRIVAYWDDIESTKGKYDFRSLDRQLQIIKENGGAKVILAVGMKAPRWPECHIPGWSNIFDAEARESVLREYIKQVITRYKDESAIVMWQVENEPYLAFGKCPERGVNFLEKEITLVKAIDSSRPILTTDGGEFGFWYGAVKAGDVFGTTMYRKVFPQFFGPLFGIIEYPLDPSFFRLREAVARILTGEVEKPFIVAELQAEPWGPESIPYLTYREQMDIYGPVYFDQTVLYAKEAGFDEYYFWGAEWWYYLKEKQSDSRFWSRGMELFDEK